MTTGLRIKVGPFELLDHLGRGGMAQVYRARHLELDQLVAIKVMTSERGGDPRFRADFRREVQAAARLNHPSIVRVFDYGLIDESAEDGMVAGSPYLVMEVADRGSLDRTRLSSWGTVRRVVLQVLDALAYSHARGLIHRDVKPANLLLANTADGRVRVKLADFGIAHAESPNAQPSDGRAVGTFAYTPPEQLHAEWRRYGPPTDLYAVGCLVWQFVTGDPPFSGESATQIAMRQLAAPLPSFEPRFEVPERLHAWLGRLLQKQPTDRFQRAADAAIAFMALTGPPPADEPDIFNSDVLLPPEATTATVDFALRVGYPDTIVVPAMPGEVLSRISSGALASGDALALGGASSGSGRRTPLSRFDERPRLPSTWRRPDVAYEPTIAGLGLGLFGLREVPFVGREGERDALWNALSLVEADERCRAVVLRGASGSGKSRIAQWVCQRADEVGCAAVFRATHAAGRRHGLRDLVERALITMGLDEHDQLLAHLRARLRELGVDGGPAFVDGEAVALAAIVRPGEFPRASQTERIATVTRLLRLWAQQRTVLVWLDDAQWDLESIALARHLASQISLRVLVVLTIQDEAARELPEVDLTLDDLLSSDFADQLRITALDEVAQTELVDRLIGLDRSLCGEVARATRGNPLFAVHLVGDWVERGALQATRRGFVLHAGADTPSDLHTLWVRRLTNACERFGGIGQQAALEAAVALGGMVRTAEWEAVCKAAALKPDEQLVPTLINLGMVVGEPGGWRFVHRLLAASVAQLSRESGRWRTLHGHCALALERLYGRRDASSEERRAAHFLEAERWEEALVPLRHAIHSRLASGDLHETFDLVSEFGRAMEQGQIDSARDQTEHELMEMMVARRMRGQVDGERLACVVERAREQGWAWILGVAHHEQGQLAAKDVRLDEALAQYELALQVLEGVGDTAEIASLLQSRAWVFKSKGDTALAQRDLEQALDTHRANNDRMRELNTINSLAFTFLAEGDYEVTRQVAQMGIDLGRELGHRGAEAGCWTTLGEIERFEGRVAEARECYRRAEELDRLCGSTHALLVRANDAMVDLLTRDWDLALERFDAIEPVMVARGHGFMEPIFALARSCCHAGRDEWTLADDLWERATAQIDDAQLIERDVAWLAEIAADVALAAGDIERARRALDYAMAQWEGLRDSRQIAATRARFASIERT